MVTWVEDQEGTMNARLHEVERERGEVREEGIIIFGDGHQQRGRCSDLCDNWTGKALGYARHIARGNEIDFPSCELLKPSLPFYGPAITFNNVNVFSGNVAAPSSSITSHGDNTRSRACDIGTTFYSTMRFPYASGTSCNMACNNASATTCNITPVAADPEATWFRNDNGHLAESQSGTRTANTIASRTCQLGSVDVEDLAMYFDSPTDGCKPPSAGNRAIHSRRSRYGQAARIDQPREYRRNLDFRGLTPFCDLAPSNLASNHLRTCDMGPNILGHCDLEYGNLRPRDSSYDGPRFHGSRFCDPKLCEEQPREPDRRDLGRGDPELGNWFCNDCPELFNFCSEERWLQCPASDRCPLYDTSYAYGAPVLPPCMYENSNNDNDNWRYGYVENEQLLEDYL